MQKTQLSVQPTTMSIPSILSLEVVKDQTNVSKNSSIFYSGTGGYAKKARQKIKTEENLKNYKIFAMMWRDTGWQDQ